MRIHLTGSKTHAANLTTGSVKRTGSGNIERSGTKADAISSYVNACGRVVISGFCFVYARGSDGEAAYGSGRSSNRTGDGKTGAGNRHNGAAVGVEVEAAARKAPTER